MPVSTTSLSSMNTTVSAAALAKPLSWDTATIVIVSVVIPSYREGSAQFATGGVAATTLVVPICAAE